MCWPLTYSLHSLTEIHHDESRFAKTKKGILTNVKGGIQQNVNPISADHQESLHWQTEDKLGLDDPCN